MCYATKRKIADCVKLLMHHKDIARITIQDIMDATQMSRQSFYYHFKDIYDVLEWIGLHDFEQQMTGEDYDCMEEWVCDVMQVLKAEKFFYEKLVMEVEWPKIANCAKRNTKAQIKHILFVSNQKVFLSHPEELEGCAEFLSTSICYYILDCLYQRKSVPDEKVINDVGFMMKLISGYGRTVETKDVTPFPKVMVM